MTTKIKNEISIYTCINKAIESQNKFIYVKRNNNLSEAFPFNNLFSAVCDFGDVSLYESGLPNEIISHIDMNIEVPRIKYIDGDSLAYYSPYEVDTKEHVLSIIKLINQLLYINITIYITDEIYKYVSCFANQNITFSCYSNPNDILIETNKIITHGYCARYFIQHKIPTIIIGPHGFGGWITPDNINFLIKENFRGRPGGRFNEALHHEILVDEILEINESIKLNQILNENVLIANNYLNGFIKKALDDVIGNTNQVYEYWSNSAKRWLLKPKLVSNVKIIKEKESIIVQRRVINDVFFSLPESDLEFVTDLKNDFTCKDLQVKHEVSEEEFWEIMNPLWELKAIYFSL